MAFSKAEQLRGFYNRFSGGNRVLIVINADPDSIASALAVKRLLWRKVAGIAIACVNQVERPDNEAMVSLLRIDLMRIKDIDHGEFDKFVLVDGQPRHHPKFGGFSFDIVIDHHPLESDTEAPFQDIRPNYGATASIMTEYLKTAKIKPNVKLATALFYAVKTDTGNFARGAAAEDVKAFQFLYKFTNIHIINKIEKTGIKGKYLKYFERALMNRRRYKGNLITHLNTVVSPDVCVIIADFLMTVDFVSWCFVSGVHRNKLVIIIRNDGLRKDAGKLAKRKFGELGNAGGHKSMARAEIPLDGLTRYCDSAKEDQVLKWLVREIQKA